jgi:hypothetical protein
MTLTRLNLVDREYHSPRHWILLHILPHIHIQGVIFSKITRLISLSEALTSSLSGPVNGTGC